MPTIAAIEPRFRTVGGVRIRYAESDGPTEVATDVNAFPVGS